MPKKLAPWTVEEETAQVKILAAAKVSGATQADLARAAGVNEVTMHRWIKRQTHLTPAQLARMLARAESASSSGPTMPMAPSNTPGPAQPDPAAGPLPQGLKAAIAMLESLAGPELEETGAAPRDLRTRLARRHCRLALGVLVRTAVTARTEGARTRAAEALLEFAYGKATQAVLDLTPKPPAEDPELVAALANLISQPSPQLAKLAAPRGGSDGETEEVRTEAPAGPEPERGPEDRVAPAGEPASGEAQPEGA